MRICVIGNSHAGAIKEGWDRIAASFPAISMEFFAAAGKGMDDLQLSEGRLIAGTKKQAESMRLSSGGSAEIWPEHYDRFLIVGMGLRPPQLDRRLSEQVIDATLTAMTQIAPFRVARMIRSLSLAPILVLPVPLYALPPRPEEMQDRFIGCDDCLNRVDALARIEGLRVVPQPEDTRSSEWTTAEKWSVGSRPLGATVGVKPEALHPDGEFNHMNAAFGEVWLGSILAEFANESAAT